jgi:hypothetical protein
MMDQTQRPSLNVIRVLVAMLAMGMILMTGVFVALNVTGAAKVPSPTPPETFLYALGALAVGVTVALLIVPRVMMKQAAAQYRAATTDADRERAFLQSLTTATITRCALVEGVGLFGAVIFFLTGMWPVLAAPAIAALMLVAFFPTNGKAQAFREKLERAMVR